MTLMEAILVSVYAAINLGAFGLMALDKAQSRKFGAERISEGVLFFVAVALGGAGIWLGMFAFRHKTRVWPFLLGIPLALVQNLAVIWLLMSGLNSPR